MRMRLRCFFSYCVQNNAESVRHNVLIIKEMGDISKASVDRTEYIYMRLFKTILVSWWTEKLLVSLQCNVELHINCLIFRLLAPMERMLRSVITFLLVSN